ncbi:LutC/YkgG family protein [Desulfolutivibrio sp.]|uniref:LutC/YkgG family protein n=1 Tax=Desulfolutivibrio sp. TaxID=2773296 RepID=UPI002F960CD1
MKPSGKCTVPDARAAMLARLEAALSDAPRPPEQTSAPAAQQIDQPDGDALLAAFLGNLDMAGVTHYTAATPQEAADAIRSYLRAAGAHRVAVWEGDVLAGMAGFDVPGVVRDMGLAVATPHGERPCPDAARAEVGITGATAGLAATGTVVVTSGPGMPRSVSIAAPAHMALMPQSRILPDLAAYFATLSPTAGLPSAIHAISGASSTGDIEFVYVKGAHGPVAVHVIVLGWR